MKPRLLILTAGYGEGHNAAARALAAACDAAHGPGAAHQSDVFALAAPRLNAITRRGYLTAINRTPRLWSAIYIWTDRSTVLPRALFWLLRKETRLLETIIAREQPTAICSTYPVYAFMLEKLRLAGRLAVPHFNIVTDSISINSLWWRAGGAGWFLPNEDSAQPLRRAGIDVGQLHVCGFPVTAFFSENADLLRPPDFAAGAAPRVLYIINSGTRGAEETARRLLAETDWEITCAVGRDDQLRAALTRFARHRARPANILGWTDQIPRLLMTHHVVVSKAGGATTQEAIAARCPMIVNQVVPGQEEGNYELLRRHGAGALAETPDTVVATLRAAFADRGRGWQTWRHALTPIARPEAAWAIVEKVFELVNNPSEPVPVPLASGGAVPSPRMAPLAGEGTRPPSTVVERATVA